MEKRLKTAYGLGKAGAILALITFVLGAVCFTLIMVGVFAGVTMFDDVATALTGYTTLSAIPTSVTQTALFSGLVAGGVFGLRFVYAFLFALPSMILAFIGYKNLKTSKTKGTTLLFIAAGLMVPYLIKGSILGLVAFALLLASAILSAIPSKGYTNDRQY